MFTGLIECLGTVSSIKQQGTSSVIAIKADLPEFEVVEGGSVAIDGSCLTVEKSSGGLLYFSAVRETLSRTTLCNIHAGRKVNMERAVQLGGRLDGHMVLGHVDGIGKIVSDNDVGGSILRTIRVPAELNKFMAEKGSVAIDGISLTIAKVQDDLIVISFIPVTISKTTMALKKSGDQVNLECDVLARYLHRLLEGADKDSTQGTLLSKMERLGF
ncbi:MAG TPA: riboflavin synthase [Chitinispirillaceae bacterium]|nr:riboflavin synthase [Chitinispirillaceae bacterium]